MSGELVWVDLEMTGLDPQTCTILEIAVLVTDAELNPLPGEFEAVIHHERADLDRMDPKIVELHRPSGLLARSVASSTTLAQAEQGALALVARYAAKEEPPLCGNSIHVDRSFLKKYMPQFNAYLHYRHVDVTTLKELARRWYPDLPRFPKAESHSALADIRESIGELRHYRSKIFVPPSGRL